MTEHLPPGWVSVTPPEISENLDSRRVPVTAKDRKPGPYPYYGANGEVDQVESYLFEGDHVLVAEDGGYFNDVGRNVAYTASGRFWVNNHAHVLKPLGGVPNQLIAHALNQVDWSNHISGTTRSKLNQRSLNRVKFPLPPLNEQRRIVEKIDACMERSGRAKAALDAIPALLDRYRQSVLAAAFRGDLTADWRAQNPGFEPAKVRTIDDLLADPIRNGLSIKGSEQPPGVAALRLSSLRSSVVDLSDVRYLPISSERAKKYILKTGDILISRGNGTKSLVARSAIVPIVNSEIIFPDTAFRVRLDSRTSEPLWLSLIWNSPQIRFQIERLAKTSAGIWKVSQSDIRSVEIPVPSLPEQMETSQYIKASFSLIDDIEKRLMEASTGLDSLNQSILAKAFRGDLVPQDPDDEPASVLLDRIRAERAAQPAKPRRRGRPPASTKAG